MPHQCRMSISLLKSCSAAQSQRLTQLLATYYWHTR